MRQRRTRAAHDSRASARFARGTRPFAASGLGARPAPIAPARRATRERRTLASACATVSAWRREVQRFLYTDFILTRLVTSYHLRPPCAILQGLFSQQACRKIFRGRKRA